MGFQNLGSRVQDVGNVGLLVFGTWELQQIKPVHSPNAGCRFHFQDSEKWIPAFLKLAFSAIPQNRNLECEPHKQAKGPHRVRPS